MAECVFPEATEYSLTECVFSRQHDTALRMPGICEYTNAVGTLFWLFFSLIELKISESSWFNLNFSF